eukprot:1214226-Pleurochrysis_carterae.AAC.1
MQAASISPQIRSHAASAPLKECHAYHQNPAQALAASSLSQSLAVTAIQQPRANATKRPQRILRWTARPPLATLQPAAS